MTCLDKGGAALRTEAVRSTAAVKASAGVTAMTREAAWSGNNGRFNFRICWKSSRAGRVGEQVELGATASDEPVDCGGELPRLVGRWCGEVLGGRRLREGRVEGGEW